MFSYVVARDYGFAPNPFHGACTLATCKPNIRRTASIGDWIVGTGSAKRDRRGFLVFFMRVTEAMTFNDYWKDDRFRRKVPNLRGSKKQAFGDNIYFREATGHWCQQDSHHSYRDGKPNPHNIRNDTQMDRVLVSTDFAYWGGSGPEIPLQFGNFHRDDICAGRNHKCRFPRDLIDDFVTWVRSLGASGYCGAPLDWTRTS